jgi:hypothetical protein
MESKSAAEGPSEHKMQALSRIRYRQPLMLDEPTANAEEHAFIEMRDKTASRLFRAKKKLDHFLEAALPGIYLPLYTMVTFTRIPYAQAARRARLQDRIVYAGLILIAISILLFR